MNRSGYKRRHVGRIMLLAVCLLLVVTGCAQVESPDIAPVSDGMDGSATHSPKGALPDGWHVYLPDMEFSTVAVVEGIPVAGGLRGLFRYASATDSWTELEPEGPPLRLIKSIAADAEGNVWIGHENGLTCLPAGTLSLPDVMRTARHLPELDGKRLKAVNSILAASDGTVYAGTFDGALRISRQDASTWIKTGELGEATLLGTRDGLMHPMVNVLFEDSRSTLWFGAYIARGGGVSCVRGDVVQQFNHENGLPDDYVTTIAEDGEGAVWIGTGVYTSGGAARFVYEDGAYRASGMRVRADGLAGEKVRYIHLDAGGRLWFCSEYDGIAVFDASGTRVALITEDTGLPDNEVKQMAREPDGSVWFACRRGLLRMDASAMSAIGK